MLRSGTGMLEHYIWRTENLYFMLASSTIVVQLEQEKANSSLKSTADVCFHFVDMCIAPVYTIMFETVLTGIGSTNQLSGFPQEKQKISIACQNRLSGKSII